MLSLFDTTRLAGKSYHFLLTNLHQLWKLATIRLLTTLLSASLIEWLSLEIEYQWLDTKFSGKFFLFAFAKILIYIVTFSSVATSWHRATANTKGLEQALTPSLDRSSQRYAIHTLLLSSAILLALTILLYGTNTIAAALAPLFSQEDKVASRLITMPTLLLLLIASCKWLPTLPSLAIENTQQKSWQLNWVTVPLTSAITLFALGLMTLLPLATASRHFLKLARDADLWTQIPLILLSELAMGCALLCFLASLSFYQSSSTAKH